MSKKTQKNNFDQFNSKYIGKYQIIKKIGEGSYARIYKVKKDSSDTQYCLKNIPISEEDISSMNEILNESSILSTCNNVYVIKYYDSFFYNGTFNIITEFCPYGDLFGYIKFYKVRGSKIEEKIIWIIFIQLSLGLYYLHEKKILHRDIKTKNIFIKNNLTVKIGDFGIAKILNSTSSYAHTFIGTPYYISPELCKDQPYNDKSDVWSLGCVLYELCTLNHPFEGGTQVEIYEKIMTQKFKAIGSEYSNELKRMVDLLLEKDERKRPKMKDILRMKSVIERANKYNIELNLNDFGIILEEEKEKNTVNKNNRDKYSIKNNSYNINMNININNNYRDVIDIKNNIKKEKCERSPTNFINKAKKNKNENNENNKETKINKIKIDNILKNNQIKKNINNTKTKSLINKPNVMVFNNKNKLSQNNNSNTSNTNNIQAEEEIKLYNYQNINKQFKEVINDDKINNNNNNKIKFSSPNELNNNKIKENKFKIKTKKRGTNIPSQKVITKISNDLSLSLNTSNSQNSKYSINNNDYSSENIIRQNNYYYPKKEAIFKKQQHKNMKLIINKKEPNDNNEIKNSKQDFIIKTRTSNNNKIKKLNNNIIIDETNDISDDKEIIKENENYLSDENDITNEVINSNKKESKIKKDVKIPKKIYLPSPLKSENKSFTNLKEFTLEKIPAEKLNNSFTMEQNKENVKIFIESNNSLNNKSNSEVISENIKLQKAKEDKIKQIKKNENEMKSISYGVYQHVINVYKTIEADNKDISQLTESLIKYMRQNLIIKDNKDSEKLYKSFKKSFSNYILCEIELKNVENQIDQRKIGGKWVLTPNDKNNNDNNDEANVINEDDDLKENKINLKAK